MSITAAAAQAIIRQMKAEGDKYSAAQARGDVEAMAQAHDNNIAWSHYLNDNGYETSYNRLTGDWSIAGMSLYGSAANPTSSQASNAYYPSQPVASTPPIKANPDGTQNTSLLRADNPNIGGLISAGIVVGVLFLLLK